MNPMTHQERREQLVAIAQDLIHHLQEHEDKGRGLVRAYEHHQRLVRIFKEQLEHVQQAIKWFRNGGDPDTFQADEPCPF